MPNPVAAIGSGAVLSAVSGEAASKRGRASDRENLAFQTNRYNDWKEIYGPIEENLSEYYSNLTPDTLIAQGLQNQQQEFQKAEVYIRENIAQRGLEGSGLEAAASNTLAIQNAMSKAQVRTNAPEIVASQKQQFVQGGNARRDSAERGISSSIQGRADRQRSEAASKFNAAGNLLSMGVQNFGSSTPSTTASTSTTLRA